MTIEQKARKMTADEAFIAVSAYDSGHKSGIIEGLEMAIEMVEQYPSPLDDLPMAMAMRNVAKAIRALIEEQKV